MTDPHSSPHPSPKPQPNPAPNPTPHPDPPPNPAPNSQPYPQSYPGLQPHPQPYPQESQFSAPAPRPQGTGKAPTILMILGGIVLVISLAVGITLTVVSIFSTVGGIDDIEVFEGGIGSVTAEEGDVLQLYKLADAPDPTCEVMAPSADAVGEGTIQTSSTTLEGAQWQSFDSFTANEAGEYSIDCAGAPVAVGPPLSIGGIFGAVGGVLLAVGGGFLGLVLLGLGVLLLVLRRRQARA